MKPELAPPPPQPEPPATPEQHISPVEDAYLITSALDTYYTKLSTEYPTDVLESARSTAAERIVALTTISQPHSNKIILKSGKNEVTSGIRRYRARRFTRREAPAPPRFNANQTVVTRTALEMTAHEYAAYDELQTLQSRLAAGNSEVTVDTLIAAKQSARQEKAKRTVAESILSRDVLPHYPHEEMRDKSLRKRRDTTPATSFAPEPLPADGLVRRKYVSVDASNLFNTKKPRIPPAPIIGPNGTEILPRAPLEPTKIIEIDYTSREAATPHRRVEPRHARAGSLRRTLITRSSKRHNVRSVGRHAAS